MIKRKSSKFLLMIILCLATVCCISCASAGDEKKPEVPKKTIDYTGVQTINGFENNDDLYSIKQLGVNVDLTYSMEISGEQKHSGKNSLKIYYERGTFGNIVQPLSQTEYADCKIGDIKAVSLWVYNDNDVESSMAFSAMKKGKIAILQKDFTLKSKEWTKCELLLNKVAMESNASNFYAFSFAFSQTLKPATYYVDNMQIEFGSEYTQEDRENLEEVNSIISLIDGLPESVTKADEQRMKEIYQKYIALKTEYQGAISNSSKYEKAIDQMLTIARGSINYAVESPACFFDKFYGAYQVSMGAFGRTDIYYTEEIKHGDEQGSLCIDVKGESAWSELYFSSLIPIAGYATTSCYIYNGTEAAIGACLNWVKLERIEPGQWFKLEVDNAKLNGAISLQFTTLGVGGQATPTVGKVCISQLKMSPRVKEQEVFTVYDMDDFTGIVKETFGNVNTYDGTLSSVEKDGKSVLKLTAENIVNKNANGKEISAKNVSIKYNNKSAFLNEYDVIRFSVYNQYLTAVNVHIINTDWSIHKIFALAPQAWTEIELSVEDFVQAGMMLFECEGMMNAQSISGVEFFISDIQATGRLYVMKLINDLPDASSVTAADKEKVQKVLNEYHKLSDAHKEMVENYQKLLQCKQNAGV